MEKNLYSTYRSMRQYYYTHEGKSNGPRQTPLEASIALPLARAALAAGKPRYYYGKSDHGPLEGCIDQYPFLIDLGQVKTESYGHNWQSKHSGGWYTDPHGETFRDGSGLCYGVVYAMRFKGRVMFIPGHEFGGCDGGPDLDFSQAIIAKNEKDSHIPFSDYDAAGEAAKAADKLAKDAAETEQEYQAAWQAGNRWNYEKEEALELRKQTQQILAERRKAKSFEGFPALCAALKATISSNLSGIRKSRKTRAKLASGNHEHFGFFEGGKRLREAFNDGAGQEVLK